jgi:hypothetical protein
MEYPTVINDRGISIPIRNITLKDIEEAGATYKLVLSHSQ